MFLSANGFKLNNVLQCKSDGSLNQAGAVQNTYYTILDTKYNIKVRHIIIQCTVANETLEVRITVDGKTMSGTVAATFGTYYYVHEGLTADTLLIDTNASLLYESGLIEGKSVKVEMRKTTAAGASALVGVVKYSQ